jgi:signal transduction histidine kinase
MQLYLFLFLFSFFLINVNGEENRSPLNNEAHKQILHRIDSGAYASASVNLNKFALDKLLNYDRILDSLYKAERDDSLAFLENNYISGANAKKVALDSLHRKINEVSIQKSEIDNTYKSLIKKALFSFGLWLLIVIVILQFRNKALAKSKYNFLKTNAQLKSMEGLVTKADQLLKGLTGNRERINKLHKEFSFLSESFSAGVNSENISPAKKYIIEKTDQIKQKLEEEDKITEAILHQLGEDKGVFELSDINSVCNLYTDIASRGLMNDAFNIQVTKDFEKNLPPIKINSTAVGTLILNILCNAFSSVNEKSNSGVKEYIPKIALSTRILPRFLQIRIRDNGKGMSDEVIQKAATEFYSTRPPGQGSGLGLYVAQSIAKEMHSGEVKIESEKGNSTDVYIKFFK